DVPSPAAGVITKILKQAGDTAEVGEVIAYLDEVAASAEKKAPEKAPAAEAPKPAAPPTPEPPKPAPPAAEPQAAAKSEPAKSEPAKTEAAPPSGALAPQQPNHASKS